MSRWLWLLLPWPIALVLAGWTIWQRVQATRRFQRLSYVDQIQPLRPDRPLTLPEVRSLKGVRIDRAVEKIAQFRR